MAGANAKVLTACLLSRRYTGPVVKLDSFEVAVWHSWTYPIVGEEDTLQTGTFWKRHGILVLANFVSLHVLDGVEEARAPIRSGRAIANGHNVVSPAGNRHHGGALGSIDSVCDAEKCVYSDVVGRGDDRHEGVAQRHGEDGFSLGQLRSPFSAMSPAVQGSEQD